MGFRCYLVSRKLAALTADETIPSSAAGHVARCERCAEEAAAYGRMRDSLRRTAEDAETCELTWAGLRTALAESPRRSPSIRRTPVFAAAFCALIVLLGGSLILKMNHGRPAKARPTVVAVNQQPLPPEKTAAPAVTAPVHTADAPSQRAERATGLRIAGATYHRYRLRLASTAPVRAVRRPVVEHVANARITTKVTPEIVNDTAEMMARSINNLANYMRPATCLKMKEELKQDILEGPQPEVEES